MTSQFVRGQLGADPQLYDTQQGKVARLRVAEARPRTEDGGESVWFDVTVWDDQASRAAKLLHSGDPVLIWGTWQVDVWQDDEGKRRTKNYIRASAVGPDLSRCSVENLARVQRQQSAEQPSNKTNGQKPEPATVPASATQPSAEADPVDPMDEE